MYLIELKDVQGHEQANERPAVVIAKHQSNTGMLIIIPMTSNLNAKRFPNTLEIKNPIIMVYPKIQ
ncbi:type II toxin-antitoxin system PemK/MazF family toxin [Oxyplasma meridianum]|uniref:type II toxin-antitoxin system PemK/MazF family toxin n=1 Tax=Oxyplasma meridianum TaxID=3073602 RepID=UPI00372CF2F7